MHPLLNIYENTQFVKDDQQIQIMLVVVRPHKFQSSYEYLRFQLPSEQLSFLLNAHIFLFPSPPPSLVEEASTLRNEMINQL